MSIKKTFRLAELTMGEMKEVLPTNPVVLLPMGSFEDQGPHAPTGDYLSADAMAVKIAEAATAKGIPTFVAPPIPFGGDDGFSASPGGITLSQSTLTAVISDMLASLLRHGITRIVVINGHGGNVGPIAEVARKLYLEKKVVLPSLYLWKISYGLLPGLIGAEKAKAVSGHGSDPLTSIGLHLFPELIRKDLIPEGKKLKNDSVLGLPYTGLGTASFDGAEVGLPMEYDDTYHDGVAGGDPKLCSAETGAVLVEKLTDIVARFSAHFASKIKA